MDAVAEMEDPFVALAALDLIHDGTVEPPVLALSQGMMTADNLYSEQWLLAYEALVKGWLPSANGIDYISDDDFFGALRWGDVEFYDTSVEVPPAEIGY